MRVGKWAIGGSIGGLAGSLTAVILTRAIKQILDFVSGSGFVWMLVLPLLGVTLAVLLLFVIGKGAPVQSLAPIQDKNSDRPPKLTWYSFPHDVARADLTGDVVNTAGVEERFPWRRAPLRALAILATVGLGAPMGTESPAAHIGVATGTWLGSKNPALDWLVRPAAVGGGAAAVSALMGIPLVGSFFMFELGRRRKIPLTPERAAAMLAGGFIGWGVNFIFKLSLIRLIVPRVPPADLWQAAVAALFVGALAGALASLSGEAIYWARGLKLAPATRLLFGVPAMLAIALVIAGIASPAAAFGPGGGAIVWAENARTTPYHLLAVSLLRAALTTAAVVAGGCGGVFVPFLAIGDLAGRVFATAFGVPSDLAGAAGAAAAIAGGYRLPLTAMAMVLGIGGPTEATLTCLATVGIATFAGLIAARTADKLTDSLRAAIGEPPSKN
jgi:H+/Cl- antiporter ClcA